jgi:CheY-like chemotaxis protein
MGQAKPFKPIAVVVEDDVLQRELVVVLLEESEISVIQCQSAEEALRVLKKMGGRVSMMFTDVKLAGKIDGVELAHFATQCYPENPRHRDLGPCATEKPSRRGDVHAETMAPAGRAPRGRAFTGLTARSPVRPVVVAKPATPHPFLELFPPLLICPVGVSRSTQGAPTPMP